MEIGLGETACCDVRRDEGVCRAGVGGAEDMELYGPDIAGFDVSPRGGGGPGDSSDAFANASALVSITATTSRVVGQACQINRRDVKMRSRRVHFPCSEVAPRVSLYQKTDRRESLPKTTTTKLPNHQIYPWITRLGTTKHLLQRMPL